MPISLATDLSQSALAELSVANPTSLQFGPDGRLYVAQQDGVIKVLTIASTATSHRVISSETIDLVAKIPNHDDNGALNAAIDTRLVTGLLVTQGAGGRPVIYVNSSDPRLDAAREQGVDPNLDTNSGTISRLTLDEHGVWQKVDLVRGLPRAEGNHATNGLQYDAATNTLYIGQGGNTNMGAASTKFAFLPEYAYAAAILKVDLNAIDQMSVKVDSATQQRYVYDLPTLNDPTRADATETVFGGNDGRNMAKITVGSPVQVFAPGFRNPYDLVLTESGRIYATDNGANGTWGGPPLSNATGPISSVNPDRGTTTFDSLHLVTEGYYGGHPNPIRANGANAGLVDEQGKLLPTSALPVDFNTAVLSLNPIEGQYLKPQGQDQSGQSQTIWTNTTSTNGIAEYTASTFGGELRGDLLTVAYNGLLHRLELNAEGTALVATESRNIGGTPLDVTVRDDGTIWIARFGANNIVVLTPSDYTPPPVPTGDEDSDGIPDIRDPFSIDAQNGMATLVRGGQTYLWSMRPADTPPGPTESLFHLGFTGLMTDGVSKPSNLYNDGNITAGGAAGAFTIDEVPAGDALGAANTQQNGFQFGIRPDATVQTLTIEARLDNFFSDISNPANGQSAGFFIGTGDQDHYLRIVAAANGGQGGIQLLFEDAGVAKNTFSYAAPGLLDALEDDSILLRLQVDATIGVVTPSWSYTTGNGAATTTGTGGTFALTGDVLAALRGTYTISGKASGLAVGLISTSDGPGAPFTATWEDIKVSATTIPPDTAAPTASGGAADLTAATAVHTATVTYADLGRGMDISTIGIDDLVIGGPGTVTVTNATTQAHANGSVTVVYSLSSPGGFTAADSGLHTISVKAGAVKDLAGNGIAGAQINTFNVAINATPPGLAEIGIGTKQAESLTLSGYEIENLASAAGGQILRVPTGTGTAKGVFTGPDGQYVLNLAHHDESDGQASMALKVNGRAVSSWVFNQATGLPDPAPGNLRDHLATVALHTSDIIEITGKKQSGEHARLDYIQVTPVGGTADTTPPTATGSAADLTAPAAAHSVSVHYLDTGSGIQASSIDITDLKVTGPSGGASVTSVVVDGSNPGSVLATYTLSSPGGFTAADSGLHTVSLQAGAVKDLAGNGVAGSVLDTFSVQIGGAPHVLDAGTPVTGALGAQIWGDARVSATSWAGNAVLVTSGADGLGVAGGRKGEQIDHNPATGASEALRLVFEEGVSSATLRLGLQNPAENGGKIEAGAWKAYDFSGGVVGQGVLDPHQGSSAGGLAYDYVIDPNADFTRLELTALAYANGAVAGSKDSSDFSLLSVTYSTDSVI
jgi:hypothetical protein